jgi:hypothetical protein
MPIQLTPKTAIATIRLYMSVVTDTMEPRPSPRPTSPGSTRMVEDQIDACHKQIRSLLTKTFSDGEPLAECMVHIHDDGTANWCQHYVPFKTADD